MDDLKFSCAVEASPYEIDPGYNANILSINQMLDKGGMKHIRALGYPMIELGEMGYGWALYQRNIHILQDIVYDNMYNLETIVTGRRRIFTYRDYHIQDASGKTCVESSSVWILFDLKNRNFVTAYPEELKNIIDPGNALEHLTRPEKIRSEKMKLDGDSATTFSYSTKVRYSEIDMLGHLSNQHHTRMIYDALPKSIYDKKRIKAINTNFNKEAPYGTEITIVAQMISEHKSFVETSSQGNTLAKAIIEFESKST